VLHGYLQRLDPAADAAALLEALWGPAGSSRMRDWAAQLLAGEWRGRSLEDWTAQIESEVGHYPLAALLEQSADGFVSPLVRTPLGAEWLRRVYDQRGLPEVRKLYSSKKSAGSLLEVAALLGVTPEQLEQDWADWTRELRAARPPGTPARRPVPAGFFFRGISFSHEGWGGRGGGYTSPEAAQQLRVLRQMGANAISLVPYGFLRSGAHTRISYAFTDETDEELTQAAYEAHRLGMKVMLKPQLWGPAGSEGSGFTGAIRFDDAAKRAQFLRNYREFLLHYARLAELEGFDLLCVGNELEGLTAHEEEWRRLVGEVRRVYHGPITYAANWGREFETLRFWDALDYMGLNNYYPLAKSRAGPPREEELVAGARALAARLEDLSRKWQRPILLTEVGYPSVHGAAAEPWVEDPGRGIQPEEQAACYQAIFAAFAGKPWLGGMFWWKWPSHGRGGGPSDPSYTPLGKPAAEILRAWYTQMALYRPVQGMAAPNRRDTP